MLQNKDMLLRLINNKENQHEKSPTPQLLTYVPQTHFKSKTEYLPNFS